MIRERQDETHFDAFAETYAETLDRSLRFTGADRDAFAATRTGWVRRLEDEAGRVPARILDLGCGDGGTEVHITRLYPHAQIVGVDVSSRSIEVAAARGLPHCEFLAFDGLHLPFGDQEFDLVFMAGVLHHVAADQTRAVLLQETCRVLPPGRPAYVFEQNPAHPGTRWITDRCPFDSDARLVAASELRRLLRSAGLDPPQTYYLSFFPRHRALARLNAVEHRLRRLPLGAQYFCAGLRN